MTTPADFEEIVSPNLYFDKNFDIDAVKIAPGEYYVTSRDMALVTVLGSCIAACVHDRTQGIGGMNHFMLPADGHDSGDVVSRSMRYGTYAMEIMVNELLKMGAKRNYLEAKVFGGANILRGFSMSNIGQLNADFVVNYLGIEKIKLVAQDLLDDYPRKVYYFPKSGRVLVKQLRIAHNNTVVEREQAYRNRIKRSRLHGEIELFEPPQDPACSLEG